MKSIIAKILFENSGWVLVLNQTRNSVNNLIKNSGNASKIHNIRNLIGNSVSNSVSNFSNLIWISAITSQATVKQKKLILKELVK